MARSFDQIAADYKCYADGPYWSGAHCLDLGMPWFAPNAIGRLLNYYPLFLMKARVIELGSGGSTVFFSHLCKEIVSIETDPRWADRVNARVGSNVSLYCVDDPIRFISDELQGSFDVALVDGDPSKYPRGQAASLLLPKMNPDAIFMVDNYYLHGSIVEEFTVPTEWVHEDYNDKHWHGVGTRISARGKVH